MFNASLVPTGSHSATLIGSNGESFEYADKDGSGRFAPPAGALSALQQHVDSSYSETLLDGLRRDYTSSGQLSRMVQPSGAIWTILRNVDEQVRAVVQPGQLRLTYSYDINRNLRRIQDSAGRITTLTIDGAGDLVEILGPGDQRNQYVYDVRHQIRAAIDPEGQRTTYAYDSLGCVDIHRTSTMSAAIQTKPAKLQAFFS